jgi:hypothetical protein
MTTGDDRGDRWLGDALDDAVGDVEPRHDLDGVRARIEEDAMRTRTRNGWAAAGAGLAVAATVVAVALATGVGTADRDDGAGPAASPSPAASAGTEEPTPTDEGSSVASPASGAPVAVYYVGDTPTGPLLFREFRAPEGDGDDLAVSVGMATSVTPLDPDYRAPWPRGTEATASYDEDGELMTVDVRNEGTELRGRPGGTSDAEARMALEQLMFTAQAAVQERVPVRFLLDGEVTDQLLGEPTSEPLAQGDPMQVQAPVWVITPQEGEEVSGTLTVEGRGAFFEANVSWQVLQGGSVVDDGFATAQECCTLSPFSFEVTDLPPGDYLLRVYDADMSGGEGLGEQEDTKRFTVTG